MQCTLGQNEACLHCYIILVYVKNKKQNRQHPKLDKDTIIVHNHHRHSYVAEIYGSCLRVSRGNNHQSTTNIKIGSRFRTKDPLQWANGRSTRYRMTASMLHAHTSHFSLWKLAPATEEGGRLRRLRTTSRRSLHSHPTTPCTVPTSPRTKQHSLVRCLSR